MIIYLRAITLGKVEAFRKIVIEIIPEPVIKEFTGIADLIAQRLESIQAADTSEGEDEDTKKSGEDKNKDIENTSDGNEDIELDDNNINAGELDSQEQEKVPDEPKSDKRSILIKAIYNPFAK